MGADSVNPESDSRYRQRKLKFRLAKSEKYLASNGDIEANFAGAPEPPAQALADFQTYQAEQNKIGMEQAAAHSGANRTATLSSGQTVSIPNAKVKPVKN
jgi:hypothetical protein